LLPCDDYNTKGECIGNLTEHTEAPSNATDDTIHNTVEDTQYFHDQSIARCTHSAFKTATSELWACVATRRGERANPVTDDELAKDAPKAFDAGIWVHRASDTDYQALKPYFGYLPVETIARTFENSTQCGHIFNSEEGNQFKRYKSPQPAMNIHRWDEDILMDEIFSGTPAIDGGFKSAMVFFGRKSHITHVEEVAVKGFVDRWFVGLELFELVPFCSNLLSFMFPHGLLLAVEFLQSINTTDLTFWVALLQKSLWGFKICVQLQAIVSRRWDCGWKIITFFFE